MIREPYHPLLVGGKKMLTRHWNLHWIDWWDRAGVWAGTSVHLYLCVRVTREALHTSSLTHFLPNTICKGEMEAILLLLWPPSTEALIIVAASRHIHPCGTYCIYPAWIFHEYWGSNCNVRHNAYFRWHMTDVFRDLGLLCTCNIHLLPESWSFPLLHWLKSKKENKCAFWMYLIFYWNNELRYCHVCFPLSFPKDRAQR